MSEQPLTSAPSSSENLFWQPAQFSPQVKGADHERAAAVRYFIAHRFFRHIETQFDGSSFSLSFLKRVFRTFMV